MKKYNIFVIKVERKTKLSQCDAHVSEIEFMNIPCDLVIDNNGSLKDLEEKLVKLHDT